MTDISKNRGHSIAIIGMGCVFPGMHSPEELWRNVLAGRSFFRRAPSELLQGEAILDTDLTRLKDRSNSKVAVITDWNFDHVKFGISQNAFSDADMDYYLALFTAKQAIEDAGVNLENVDRTRIGVVLWQHFNDEICTKS